jgi:hypothetical protein
MQEGMNGGTQSRIGGKRNAYKIMIGNPEGRKMTNLKVGQ